MPFIDLAYLRKKDLKGDCIVYCRHKTKRQITVRIPPEARVLLEEYSNRDNRSIYLFPILDGQGEEEKTKNAEKLYERYAKALGSFNRMLAKIASLLLPGVEISSYTARHTWATLAFHAGVPIGIISKALGHSSIKVTETYLKPFENEKVDVANDELISSVTRCGEEKNAA
jgi:tyrosine site-specific recombinase